MAILGGAQFLVSEVLLYRGRLTAAEREANNLKGVKYFCLKMAQAKARNWTVLFGSNSLDSGPGFFFFFFTLVTGPRRSLSLKLSDLRLIGPGLSGR